jgi:hypothetical protein
MESMMSRGDQGLFSVALSSGGSSEAKGRERYHSLSIPIYLGAAEKLTTTLSLLPHRDGHTK